MGQKVRITDLSYLPLPETAGSPRSPMQWCCSIPCLKTPQETNTA